ncbi:carbohydrate ABC transporter permease [Evansella cellulosilytica]|uniref:Binding-protein-dependent transport systems inner membrane component n=1 Tax=Evansella cellulosilytica (strain ATCC 21833 / DSM 2522 / FERM P-1141 / JCM 9156 / N-4) TaxID=649639 RepID=E6TR07_EVAC2|nr:sugar ABC transporter permease [Evansella cellulosilytica]ADU29383.1 binding-protein-dependent transport systems inner membrane component [Evansella cellulosilytica DSM 2522]
MSDTSATSKNKQNKILKFLNSKKVVPYVLVSPFILSFLVLTLYPTIQAFIMSFQTILPGQVTFVGLSNYDRIFNPTFYKALQNTTIYMILTVFILVSVPILLAILLDSKITKFKTIFRSALFIPSLTSVIVAGVIFRLVFAESDTAVANQVLGFFGVDPVNWRYNSWSAMFLMVTLASWRWMGVNVLYFLAGLQNIPKELYESAEIDGANVFHKFKNITLPFLKPIIIFVSTISIIAGFRMFEESYVFWETSSPGNIGLTLVGYLYQQGIQQNDMGFGAAIGVVILIIVFVVSLIQLLLTGAFKRSDV